MKYQKTFCSLCTLIKILNAEILFSSGLMLFCCWWHSDNKMNHLIEGNYLKLHQRTDSDWVPRPRSPFSLCVCAPQICNLSHAGIQTTLDDLHINYSRLLILRLRNAAFLWCSCRPCRALDEGRCVAECSKGKYQSGGQCHLCDHTCATCVDAGAGSCTSCETGEHRMRAAGWMCSVWGKYHSSGTFHVKVSPVTQMLLVV